MNDDALPSPPPPHDLASTPTRLERWAPWVAGTLLAAPVLVARYPPMTDLPLHEALVGMLRHFDDTSMFPSGLYAKNFGEPNQLFHLVAWALSHAMATDTASKLVVAASIVAIPVCAARFASHVGASRLAAIVVAPLALGWMFSWGLVANLIGLAVFLALLPNLDRFAAKPTARGAAVALGGAITLYFAHLAMMIVYAGAALWIAVCYPLGVRATLVRASPFFASLAIVAGQLYYQEPYMSVTLKAVPRVFVPASAKLLQIPNLVLPSYDETTRLGFFGLCVLAVVLLLVLRSRERTEPIPRKPSAFLLRYRFELLAAGSFIAYLVFPLTLNGATLVYQRFFPPAFVIFVIVAAPRSLATRGARVMRNFLVPALPIGALLLTWPSFADSHQAHKDLDHILSHMEKGSALASLDLATSEVRTFSLGSAPARYLATRGGRMHYAFTDSAIAPVVMRPAYQWNEALVRIAKNGWAFRPSYDLKHFRYVIVRSLDARLQVLAAHAMKPEARAVANAGEWLLLESTLPLVPLLSPEEPMPSPKPPTLRQRMLATLDELTKDNGEPPPEIGSDQEPADPTRGLRAP